jgi:hypothetical protein
MTKIKTKRKKRGGNIDEWLADCEKEKIQFTDVFRGGTGE